MSCFDTGWEQTFFIFTAIKRAEAKHYVDNTGYGIFKYDDTYTGSCSVDGNKNMDADAFTMDGPNESRKEDIQENKIGFSPWE